MEIRLEMIVYVGSRNKCSTEMNVKNMIIIITKKAIRVIMTELINNYKKMEIIIMKQVCE